MTSVHNCEGSRMLKNKHTRSDGNTLNTACYAKVSLSVLPNNNIVSPVCQPASHKWDLSLPLSLLLAPLCRNFVLWCTALKSNTLWYHKGHWYLSHVNGHIHPARWDCGSVSFSHFKIVFSLTSNWKNYSCLPLKVVQPCVRLFTN